MAQARLPRKDVRKLVQKLERQGFRTRYSGGGHVKVLAPDGVGMVILSTTGRQTSVRNQLGELRRIGAKV